MAMLTSCILSLGWLLAAAPRTATPPAEHTWTVIASQELDARLRRQLEVLAAQDQALIRFARSPRETRRRVLPGNLSLEMHEEKSLDSFLKLLQREAANSPQAPTAQLAYEGYILEAHYPHASVPNRIRITAANPQGFHQALLRIPDLLTIWPSSLASRLNPPPRSVRVYKAGLEAIMADFPSFPERGIVEGFYGTPWSHQDRLDMLHFEGQHRMNVYYYAPKDDPYHRKLWRDPYPSAEAKHLGDLVESARANFVDFCFAISPGLSMTYSSEQDFATLVQKLMSVEKLGVSCFALFLDDVPQELQKPEDLAQFKTLAQAHIYLINKLYKNLKSRSPQNRLTVTPTVYTNAWGSRDYVKELGAGVDPGVPIVWTGPEVASPKISVADAQEWGGLLHRKPLVWDNFPVNDGRRWRLHLGPLRGRDPNLPVAIEGLVSNPMNQARASMLPLQTVADYLWNSAAYDPAKSHAHALVSQYGKDAPKLLAAYLHAYGDYWWDENIFTPLFSERRYPFDVARISAQIDQLAASLSPLRTLPRFERLLPDLSPFSERTRERLEKVGADPAFRHLPDGRLQWREDYNALSALRVAHVPKIDGDFSKWQDGPLYVLNEVSQVVRGADLWKGPDQLSARVSLRWDDDYLYLAADVIDPQLYQPFFGRGIDNGDALVLFLETAFRKNFQAIEPTGDQYLLYFSPGNFADVKPSIFSDEDYLPPRPHPHDYNKEILTAWRKTPAGYSGDMAIPISFFAGRKFSAGSEIGLSFGLQKAFPPVKPGEEEEPRTTVFTSKSDPLFHVNLGNPSSYQRLVLIDTER